MSDEQLEARFQAVETRLQAMEARWEERFDQLLKFMAQEFQTIRRDFAALERQVGFLGETTAGVQSQMAALTRHFAGYEPELGQLRGTQAGQQRPWRILTAVSAAWRKGTAPGRIPKSACSVIQ